jgi:hypothetical protein
MSTYEDYLQNWEQPIHPNSEEELTPLSVDDFYMLREELTETEEQALEEMLQDIDPISNEDYIDVISSIKTL